MDNTTIEAKQAIPLPDFADDLFYIKLAREIAINHYTLDEILRRFNVDKDRWVRIRRDLKFHKILEAEITAWNATTNTHERTKLKAAAMMEEFLPEANQRLNDPTENLPAKVELAKLITRIAGMGIDKMGVEGDGGQRFSVTINLGADANLKFEKQVTSKVISGEAMDM